MSLFGCGQDKQGIPGDPPDDPKDLYYPEPGLLPGGVADLAGKTGFLANVADGIDAVELESGKLLWQSKQANQPILLWENRLIGLSRIGPNTIRIVVLNVSQKGKKDLASDPIVLLDDKGANVHEPISYGFRGPVEDGQFRLQWQASAWKSPRGGVQVDLKSGRSAIVPEEPLIQPSLRKRSDIARVAADPEAFGPAGKLTIPLPPKLEDPKEFSGDGTFGPETDISVYKRWVVGKSLVMLLHKTEHKRIGSLLLVHWQIKTGKCNGVFTLSSGRFLGGFPYPLVCSHGRCVVLKPESRWKMKDEENQRVRVEVLPVVQGISASVVLEEGAQEPTVVGKQLFYVTRGPLNGPRNERIRPQTLKAMDLTSQRILWERPIKWQSTWWQL